MSTWPKETDLRLSCVFLSDLARSLVLSYSNVIRFIKINTSYPRVVVFSVRSFVRSFVVVENRHNCLSVLTLIDGR